MPIESVFEAADGVPIRELAWELPEPKGTVVLAHGYLEHIERYGPVAEALNQSGWSVRGADLRGHGRSGGRRCFARSLDEYLDDLSLVVRRSRAAVPAGPLFLLGHSFGGLLAFEWALRDGSAGLTGLVLTSPFFRLKWEPPALSRLAALAGRFFPTVTAPSGIRGPDVTRDPERAAEYERTCQKRASAGWLRAVLPAQKDAMDRAERMKLPCLIVQAGDDRVSDPKAALEVFERLGSTDKAWKLLEGQRHEVLNELPADRARTLSEISAWLDARA
jgi:alpha-beta hydrolase superfamily lysophospholipase